MWMSLAVNPEHLRIEGLHTTTAIYAAPSKSGLDPSFDALT